MEHNPKIEERKEYVVGSELKLQNILNASDVDPLLKAMVPMGIMFVSVTNEKGKCMWSEGDRVFHISGLPSPLTQDIPITKSKGEGWQLSPLCYECEPIGYLFAGITNSVSKEYLSGLMNIVSTSINILIKKNAKQMITSEMHDTFTYQSYEELLETNKKLSISEQKYRELAQTLEQRVEEKTSELKKATTRLLEQEKLASIGQLAAGIAHEINNPIGYIYSNLNTFTKYIKSLSEMLQFYRNSIKERKEILLQSEISTLRSPPNPEGDGWTEDGRNPKSLAQTTGRTAPGQAEIRNLFLQSEELYKKLKIDFIINDIFDLTRQNIDGAEKIKQIVSNLKSFSHVDEASSRKMNINTEIENTVKVLSNEVKGKSARVITNYGQIPDFFGNPGFICQVFLNIILNALQSRDIGLIITIKTELKEDNITVSITDNGKGIPSDIQNRIFDPFFTTKDVGEGTGMGLAVAYDVVSNHGGTLELESKVDEGSNFIIKLPLKGKI